jgi:cytochrome o ubiquinol oxidase subunit 1
MFGKLSLSAIPFDQPIPLITSVIIILVGVGVLAFVTVKGWWPYLWREWITSVDHKRIGIMYILLGVVMLIRGFADAIMMRTQQAVAINGPGYLPPEHYNQIFSAHGTIMIFFAAMPLVIGFMNFVTPLQLGVRDVAFPTFNLVSFWLTASGALLAIQIAGVGTLITGINFVTTVLKMRCPGMSYLRMPMFTWTVLASSLIIVAVFPILTATLAMLTLDRYAGFHFFTNTAGGNPMMFMNLIWAWGHPEVYILVLPAFGIFSEVFSTFSGKPLFGYRSMVAATMFICVVSMMTWLHHFFTMGAGADVNTAFGISTSVIAVGTGVKIYNWIFTMYGGRVRLTVPMLWSLGFIFTFVIGGMTGVMLAVPPADFLVHNSMFLVAHFHNVIVGGVVFALFAGLEYWFPKAFGFRLHEGWGKAAFWFAFFGFWVTFAPLYYLGMLGMTRRLQHINMPEWRPMLELSVVGVGLIAVSAVCQVTQLVVSILERDKRRDVTGDPWDGRSLEWATPSPAPFFNFAVLPNVEGEEAYWGIKQRAIETQQMGPEPRYQPIEMPVNSPVGIYTAFFASAFGFAMIWHIWWLAALSVVAAFAGFVVFAWRDVHEFEVSADEVAQVDRARRAARAAFLERLEAQGGIAP